MLWYQFYPSFFPLTKQEEQISGDNNGKTVNYKHPCVSHLNASSSFLDSWGRERLRGFHWSPSHRNGPRTSAGLWERRSLSCASEEAWSEGKHEPLEPREVPAGSWPQGLLGRREDKLEGPERETGLEPRLRGAGRKKNAGGGMGSATLPRLEAMHQHGAKPSAEDHVQARCTRTL